MSPLAEQPRPKPEPVVIERTVRLTIDPDAWAREYDVPVAEVAQDVHSYFGGSAIAPLVSEALPAHLADVVQVTELDPATGLPARPCARCGDPITDPWNAPADDSALCKNCGDPA